MSVINQMLQDLERRRASVQERQRIPDHVRALPDGSAAPAVSRTLVLAVVALVLSVLGVVWWWGRVPEPAASVPVASPPAVPAAVNPAGTRPGPETPGESEAVAFIASRMSFELSVVPPVVEAPPAGRVPAATVLRRDPASPTVTVDPTRQVRAAPATTENAAQSPAPGAGGPRPEIAKTVREQTPAERAAMDYARGAAALHAGRTDEARSAFERALQSQARHQGARQALVGVLLQAGERDAAMQLLEEGLQLAPAQAGFAMTLARLQLDRGIAERAAEVLERSIDAGAATPDLLSFYGGVLQRLKRHEEAVAQFERALQLRPNTGIWMLGLGVSLDALGRSEEAKAAYRAAIQSGSLSADLRAFADQRLR